jgi:O-antigen/teichoic acid export membrane protein
MSLRQCAGLAHQVMRSYLTDAGRRAAVNMLGLGLCTILSQACAFLTLLMLTRTLSVEGFGTFSFALALQPYFLLLGTVGTATVVIREGTQRPKQIDAITTSYLLITGSSSTLVCLAVLGAVGVSDATLKERVLLALVAVGSVAPSMSLLPLFDVHHQQARGAVLSLVAEAVALGVIGLLAWSGRLNLIAIGTVFAGKWLLIAAGQLLVYHFTIRPLRWVFARDEIRLQLRSGWPLLVGSLASVVPFSSGIFFVRMLDGPAETALIGLAYQAGNVFLAFAWLALRILQPHISGPYGLERSFLWKLALFVVGFLATLVIFNFLIGLVVIRLCFDPVYRGALLPMGLLLGGGFMLGVSAVVQLYLTRFYEERFQMLVYCGGALLYAVACVAVVPRWGAAGAAAATVVVALLMTLLNLFRAWGQWPRSACGTPAAPVHSAMAVGSDRSREPGWQPQRR